WATQQSHGSAPLTPTQDKANIRESLFMNGKWCRGEQRSPAMNHRQPTNTPGECRHKTEKNQPTNPQKFA
ncbi:hypothetical protein, partial [Prosthecochloris ethylica]